MVTFTETAPHACGFILSEASGARSRENGVGGATLKAGEVVKLATGKMVSQAGTGTIVGILLYDCVLDQEVSYLARDAEVNLKLLSNTGEAANNPSAATITALAAMGIICRN